MNTKSETDESSRGSEASPSDSAGRDNSEEKQLQDLCLPSSGDGLQDTMKRAAAKELIEKYFYQIIDGCGNPNCSNQYCASSGEARNLTPNEAAAEAIKLFYKEAKLCDNLPLPNKVPRTDPSTCSSSASTISPKNPNMSRSATSAHSTLQTIEERPKKTKRLPHYNGVPLTEELIQNLYDEYLETKDSDNLKRVVSRAFVNPTVLARSFPTKTELPPKEDIRKEKKPETSDGSDKENEKEFKATCSSDPDKDVDSVAHPPIDMSACQRAFAVLNKVPVDEYNAMLILALTELSEAIESDLRKHKKLSLDDIVNCFVIVFELPDLGSGDYLELALPVLCRAVSYLPIAGQALLARIWSVHNHVQRRVLLGLQQLLTLTIVSTHYSDHYTLQDDMRLVHATKLIRIVYYASILAGRVDTARRREPPVSVPRRDPLADALDHLYPRAATKRSTAPIRDPLGVALDINIIDVIKPFLPFEDFYNESLSDEIEMDKDFANYKKDITGSSGKFSFLEYPFVLTVASKSLGLYYDNRIRMYSERRVSLLHAVIGGADLVPFLSLRVRRDRLIQDALVELEMVAMERTLDLKKQLVVEFEGEQGVDEGGVSKEFFQLVVDEIFNADYGMFTCQHDSRTVWFNPTSFETEAQFTLIGIVLGLAIYNNVILAVNFPMVLYKKLMGKKGTFEDLADWNPTLYNGLKDMLEYEGEDLEEVYYQTFRICHQDVFENNIFHDLKEGGNDIFVTQDNKEEFIELYADFLLNKSVDTQFRAFLRGFVMVTDESPLGELFRPEELEMLVCGSKNFDFKELEDSTEYDGGYSAESLTIKDFWQVVHSLSQNDKRKLLQFATGSDRVPVGGMTHLKLVIARNGPDSNQLPTAHTCFNVLLLPEYSSKEKLEDRLMKAINYSKGFGML